MIQFAAIAGPARLNAFSARDKFIAAPWSDPNFFPIAVWLQDPVLASRYKSAGINTYVGLYNGPTAKQLNQLGQAQMNVICAQNTVALDELTNKTIIGWMHGDEPDNAQPKPSGGYGDPLTPDAIISEYDQMKGKDPSRPVLLNLGQGVAWDEWIGRGHRTRHPEDYAEYLKGCDIGCFDIYPVNQSNPQVSGKLWMVAKGVHRLVKWGDGRPVWNAIECTAIDDPSKKPTPAEVSAEVWMSIISGSQGIIYFVHQLKPTFNASALLNDPKMLAAVTALNRQITLLAPILNSASVTNLVSTGVGSQESPVSIMTKHAPDGLYVFAVFLQNVSTSATFSINGPSPEYHVEVLNEQRDVPFANGAFEDHFGPWAVHLYHLVRKGEALSKAAKVAE